MGSHVAFVKSKRYTPSVNTQLDYKWQKHRHMETKRRLAASFLFDLLDTCIWEWSTSLAGASPSHGSPQWLLLCGRGCRTEAQPSKWLSWNLSGSNSLGCSDGQGCMRWTAKSFGLAWPLWRKHPPWIVGTSLDPGRTGQWHCGLGNILWRMPICSSIQWLWVWVEVWVDRPGPMGIAQLVSALPSVVLLVVLVVSVVHLTWVWCSHLFFLGWWLWILLIKQICVSMVIWVFTLGFLDLLVPGFNELPQWLQLWQTGIPLWLFPIEKANNWLGCWSQFEILLAFMVQNEAMWGEHWLLLLVLNFNGFLDGDHGWNSCIGWQELGTPIGLNNLAVSKQWKKAMHGMGSQWAFDLYAMVLPLCISVLFGGKRTRKKTFC